MPVSAIDLVKKLMAKAGVKHEGDLTGDIPDEVATALDNQLLTIAAATNNHPDVKNVYFAQAYNGLDSELKTVMDELAVPDDVRAEIQKAGSSTKKAAALVRKIKELSEKAVPADATKAKQLQDTITELNGKLATEINKQKELQTGFENQLKQIKIKTKLNGMLSSYKTVYDDLPVEAKEAAIDALLNKSLSENDADFTFDEKGSLSLIKKDGTNLFGDNHTLVTPQSFIDKTLSKILKVSNPAQQPPPAAPLHGSSNTSQSNTALKAALAENLQAYEAAAKSAIAV
jgi:hypothetical protein